MNSSNPALYQILEEYKTADTAADRTKTLKRQSSLRNPQARSSLLKKSVSFNNQHEQIPIENAKSLPKREIRRRWMSGSDFEKIKVDNEITLHNYQHLGSLTHHHTPTQTVRGLERFTKDGTYKYFENYRDAVLAVLSRQDNHTPLRSSSSSSTDQLQSAIAQAYREETEQAILEAISIAQHDQQIAEQEYDLDCTIESIRRQQQRERKRREMEQKRLVNRLLLKPARQMTISLSLRSVMNPQA